MSEFVGLVQEMAACNLENIDLDVHQQVPRAPEPVGDSECGRDMGDGPNSTVSWLESKQELRFIEDTDTEALKLFAEHLHNEEEYYLMSGQPRGQVLVIDNDEFIKHPEFGRLKSRPGSKEDSKDIDKLFTGLGFTVHVKQNLTKEQMRKSLENKLTEKELENCDCFVVFLLSHGDKGVVFGTDGYRDGMEPQNCLELTDVEYMICNCKYLTGKPKLLFVQACQGNKKDSGIARVASRQSTVAPRITGAQETGDRENDVQAKKKVLEEFPSEASDGITKLATSADFYRGMSTIDEKTDSGIDRVASRQSTVAPRITGAQETGDRENDVQAKKKVLEEFPSEASDGITKLATSADFYRGMSTIDEKTDSGIDRVASRQSTVAPRITGAQETGDRENDVQAKKKVLEEFPSEASDGITKLATSADFYRGMSTIDEKTDSGIDRVASRQSTVAPRITGAQETGDRENDVQAKKKVLEEFPSEASDGITKLATSADFYRGMSTIDEKTDSGIDRVASRQSTVAPRITGAQETGDRENDVQAKKKVLEEFPSEASDGITKLATSADFYRGMSTIDEKTDSGIDRVASRQSTVAPRITGAQETGDRENDVQAKKKVLEEFPSEASDGITKLATSADFYRGMSTIDEKTDSGIDRVASRQSTVAPRITGAQETGDRENDVQAKKKVLEEFPSEASDGITKLPTFADFYRGMSTIDGYRSKRNEKHGSWYIQAIIHVFSRYAYKLEFRLLMTKVNNLMSDKGINYKQIGRATDSLRKQFYFFPGLPRAPH